MHYTRQNLSLDFKPSLRVDLWVGAHEKLGVTLPSGAFFGVEHVRLDHGGHLGQDYRVGAGDGFDVVQVLLAVINFNRADTQIYVLDRFGLRPGAVESPMIIVLCREGVDDHVVAHALAVSLAVVRDFFFAQEESTGRCVIARGKKDGVVLLLDLFEEVFPMSPAA